MTFIQTLLKKYGLMFLLSLLTLIGIMVDVQLTQSFGSQYTDQRLWFLGGLFVVMLGLSFRYASLRKTQDLIRNITLSGMLIALAIILERFVSIPIGLTNRIAFGSSIVVVSSLIVGPFYGMLVGAATDIFGFMLLNVTGLAYTPFVTIGYIALGFLPFFLYRLFKQDFFNRFGFGMLIGVLLLLSGYAINFAFTNETFNFRNGPETLVIELNNVWFRVIGPLVILGVFIGFAFFIRWFNRLTQAQSLQPFAVALTVFLIEVLVTIIWGGLWRALYFGASSWVFFFTQTGFFVLGFPVKTLLVYYAYLAYLRYNANKASNEF